jgi:hypothetical protein
MAPDMGLPLAGDLMVPFCPDSRKVPMPHSDRIPPFLCKLYQIVHTPDTDHCICWSSTRDSLLIVDQAIFAKQILPLYFKHNSIRSFIRQLNTYGFRKRTRAEHVEFWNPAFKADHMELLLQIKRVGAKQESAGDDDGESSGSESAHKVELMNIDVQVQELRRELKDMRAVMQQYLQQLDFRIAMQTHMVRTGAAACASAAAEALQQEALQAEALQALQQGALQVAAVPAPAQVNENEAAWTAYLNALNPGKQPEMQQPAMQQSEMPPDMQQVMQQAHQMHINAQQVHQQQLLQLQQLQQLRQSQQQQLLFMQTQQAAGISN